MDNENLKKLSKVFNTDKIVSPEDIVEVLRGVANIMATFKKDNQSLTAEAKSAVSEMFDRIQSSHDEMLARAESIAEESKGEVSKETKKALAEVKKISKELKDLAKEIETTKPANGKDADEEKIVEEVLSKIKLPEYKETVLDGRQEIVEKINTGKKKDLKIGIAQIGGTDTFERDILNRAIGIVDQRTSFLINKVSSLQATVDENGGGSGVTVETPSGDVDGSNKVFTTTNTPKWVIIDGITYFSGAGYAYSSPTITVDTPPVLYIRSIY